MISIVIGLGLLVVIAGIFILKQQFELNDLRTEIKHANIKQRLFIDYIDTLNREKQANSKKEKK